MEFKEMARTRYSCRKFLSKEVEDDKIETMLDVIHIAPSAKNQQPVRAWVIKDPARISDVRKITSYHYNAPLTIAIGYVPEEAWIRECDNKDMGVADASIAATSVWFEATDLGLGCVWVSSFDVDKQKELFPEMSGCEMVAFMQIGYPDPEGKAANWHYEKKDRS